MNTCVHRLEHSIYKKRNKRISTFTHLTMTNTVMKLAMDAAKVPKRPNGRHDDFR
jgi:hypothetical protein